MVIIMQYFLDSADASVIRAALAEYPLAGVTTNPTILARDLPASATLAEGLAELRSLTGDKLLFVQVTSDDADGMIEDAHRIIDSIGGRLSIKLPACPEGFAALKYLAAEGISVTITAAYTTSQAMLAAAAGADYVAPYISHIDNLSLDGPTTACEMARQLKLHGYTTKVLAASFRTAAQVERVIAGGAEAVTITADMLGQLAYNTNTEREIEKFHENWSRRFDGGIRELL